MSSIANSMGDLTELMSAREVEEKFGFLDQLLPQEYPPNSTSLISDLAGSTMPIIVRLA